MHPMASTSEITTAELSVRMKFNLILLSTTLALLGNTMVTSVTMAADETTKTYTPKKTAAAHKLQIPPPPRETVPGGATGTIPVMMAPEAVRTAVDASSTTVGSGSCVAPNTKVQRFVSYVELKPGMDAAPLTLHLSNHGFSWFRLMIANRVVATEKSLGHAQEGDLDLSGMVQTGTNQFVIQAGGAPGAKIEWSVTTPAMAKIERVDPDELLVGEELKIKGKNFNAATSKNEVIFNGGKKGQVKKAKSTELTVKVPSDAEIGDNKVSVKVNGIESNKVKVKLRGIPELSGTSLQGVPPGQTIVLFGKNFSKDVGENQVFFGETPAQVVSGTDKQLVIVVPFVQYHEGHTPSQIRVQVGKVMSKNTVGVQVGPQMYSDPAVNGGDVPADTPVWSPLQMPRSNGM
jgi:hypothetical protein